MMTLEDKTISAWWALRIGLGLGPFLAGLDKFFNILTDWKMYLSPYLAHVLPIGDAVFMHAAGVVEMIVGIAVLTRWTRFGSYILAAWLVAISLNLVSTGMFFDLAVRDLEIAIAAYTLARLTEARELVDATAVNRYAELPLTQSAKVRA